MSASHCKIEAILGHAAQRDYAEPGHKPQLARSEDAHHVVGVEGEEEHCPSSREEEWRECVTQLASE